MGQEWVGQSRHQGLYRSPCRAGRHWIREREHVSGLHNTGTKYLVEFRWGHALGRIPSYWSAQSPFIKPCPLAHIARIANDNYNVAVKKALLGGRIAPSSSSANGGTSSSPTADGYPSSSLTVGGVLSSSPTGDGATSKPAHPHGGPSSSPIRDGVPSSSPTVDGAPPSSPTVDGIPSSPPYPDGDPSSSPTVDGAPASSPTADGGQTSSPYPDGDPYSSASAYDVASTGGPTRHRRPHPRKRFGANKHSHWI